MSRPSFSDLSDQAIRGGLRLSAALLLVAGCLAVPIALIQHLDPAQAQIVSPLALPTPAPVDTSGLATKAEVQAVQSAMPVPANTLPPSENTAPAVGAQTRYAREDHIHPRITRATTVTTVSGGTFGGTWTTPLPAPPTIVMTPIAAAASIDCQLTSAPTTTTFAGRCWTSQTTLLNLTLITAGLTLNPTTNTAAGIQVQVIALPPTQ